MSSLGIRPYITDEGGKKILEYKYSGSDASLMYKYFVSPAAQFLVDHVIPEWVAPNTITVFGLSLVASSHVLMALIVPTMAEDVPSWLNIWAGIALLMYQILDAADGKQARKTGNASPLGLLFDHGCDALNCVLSACTYASTLQLGPTYSSMGMLIIPCFVFFMATWEELYTGTLALPIINGPNEGLLIMYSAYIFTGLNGSEFWKESSVVFGIPHNMLFLYATFGGAVVTITQNIMNVRKSLHGDGKRSLNPILGLSPFVLLLVLASTWVHLSPVDIVQMHPRMMMWTLGLLFCKLVMHMMIAHLCEEPVQLLRKTLIITFSVAFVAVAGLIPLVSNEELLVRVFFVLSLIPYLHMVYNVIAELTTILNINCFRVKPSTLKKNKTT